MTKILDQEEGNYSGDGSVVTGEGEETVYFKVTHPSASILTLWARKTGTTDDFIPLRQETKSVIFRFDSLGLDYYFTWKIVSPIAGKLKATLDV